MLTRSNDRKVTTGVKNAFGLPAGLSCPGMTGVCEKVCYARRTEKQYKNVDAAMLRNWNALQGKSIAEMAELLSAMIGEFVTESNRRGVEKSFRIHWDGDFFSIDYAKAWAKVIKLNPDVQFWAYTRSFVPALNVVPVLARLPNLALYLSVDNENEQYVNRIIAKHNVNLATLSDTFAEAIGMVQNARGGNKPGAKCPENAKQIPLITNKTGACITCQLCVKGKSDVRFSIKRR